MSEKIPFSISEALKNPSRVRNLDGSRAVAVAHFPTAHEEYRVVIQWDYTRSETDVVSYTECGRLYLDETQPKLYLDPEQVEGEA